jgi:hypothetical protein
LALADLSRCLATGETLRFIAFIGADTFLLFVRRHSAPHCKIGFGLFERFAHVFRTLGNQPDGQTAVEVIERRMNSAKRSPAVVNCGVELFDTLANCRKFFGFVLPRGPVVDVFLRQAVEEFSGCLSVCISSGLSAVMA